jgi:methyl-accepting chemotaxis protein
MSESRLIVDAMGEFRNAFWQTTDFQPQSRTSSDIHSRLREYYESEFLPTLNRSLERPYGLDLVWPQDSRTRLLQDLYISANPYGTGEKHRLDDAGDGSVYSAVHRVYHPVLRKFLDRFGYYDIFLIEPEAGHIVYSAFKEVDFGTSLNDGPYADSGLSRAVTAVREAADSGFIRLVDYAPYLPSYNGHASFIAAPIHDGEQLIGILAFQMPVDRIDAIMTNNQSWSSVGLGESGETYIVGEDYTLRNQSRFLIEDREGYLRMIEDLGVPESTIARIANLNSSIGLQEVKTPGTTAAFRGEYGEQIITDYRGVKVLSSYRPLNVDDVNWVIMSEIDEAEAFAGVQQFGFALFVTGLTLILIFSSIGVLVAWSLSRPLARLTNTHKRSQWATSTAPSR